MEGDGAAVTHGALLADPAFGRSYVFGDTVPAAFVEKWTRHGKKQVIANCRDAAGPGLQMYMGRGVEKPKCAMVSRQ